MTEMQHRPGDSNLITRRYLDSLLVETRYIDSVIPDLTFKLYGEVFTSPIMTSAFSHLKYADKKTGISENGMVTMARGAYDAGAVMFAGMGDDEELEAMAATGAKIIKIIKPYADEKLIYHQLEAAEKNGAIGVGMDIDHIFGHDGRFDNVAGAPMSAKTARQLKKYIEHTKLPFVIKGVLSVSDAEKAMDAGAQGILVSHHHGILDYAVPPLMLLPKILEAVQERIPVFVDCGIDSGFDAFKALALGACGVCVSRSILENLSAEGSEGVRKRFAEMNGQLRQVMARTGAADVRHIPKDVLIQVPGFFF